MLMGLRSMAMRLNVSPTWLYDQYTEGRVPGLDVGRGRLLFNPIAVESALAKVAATVFVDDEPEAQSHPTVTIRNGAP